MIAHLLAATPTPAPVLPPPPHAGTGFGMKRAMVVIAVVALVLLALLVLADRLLGRRRLAPPVQYPILEPPYGRDAPPAAPSRGEPGR